jgi:hypothetical protein
MNAVCETVATQIALGEPLGELTAHVASCSRCKRVVALPSRIAAATVCPDPGLGFSARMTIGAQNKLVVRRRRRITASAAGAVAAAALAVFALTRSPSSPSPEEDRRSIAVENPNPTPIEIEAPIAASESDLAGLVRLSDTKRARRVSAPWGRIRKPLAPYIQLVKGVAP